MCLMAKSLHMDFIKLTFQGKNVYKILIEDVVMEFLYRFKQAR